MIRNCAIAINGFRLLAKPVDTDSVATVSLWRWKWIQVKANNEQFHRMKYNRNYRIVSFYFLQNRPALNRMSQTQLQLLHTYSMLLMFIIVRKLCIIFRLTRLSYII